MANKLRDLLNENCLGKLPSESMFKLNKETGKFESPSERKGKTNEDVIDESMLKPKKFKQMKDLTNDGSLKRLKAATERIRKDLSTEGFNNAEIADYISYISRTNG